MGEDNKMKLQDGRNLGFCEYGKPDGIPLLYFHGTPGSRIAKQFENVPWTKELGVFIITPERPGYGLSDPTPKQNIKDWTNDVEELADYLGLDRFHVAGISGGGPYALACGIHLQARVLSATLISSVAPPEAMKLSKEMELKNRIGFFLAKYAPFFLKLPATFQANAIKKKPEKFAKRIRSRVSEGDKSSIDEHVEGIIKSLQEAFRQGVGGYYRDVVHASRPWHLELEKLSIPVFMWHGTDDRQVPISLARQFSKLIPECETHFISGSGHFLLGSGSKEVRSQLMDRILSVKDQKVQ